MTKLIARFVKLYNFPPEVCPNVNKKRSAGALQFLVQKRYVEGSLSMYISYVMMWYFDGITERFIYCF